MAEKGNLIIQCFNGDDFIPVDGTKATVVQTESPNPKPMEFDLVTDSSGLTQAIQLDAPDFQYSQIPQSEVRPYSLCDITINREGFNPLTIKGCQIFPRETAYQRCNLVETSNTRSSRAEIIEIPDNRLFGKFPKKIPEEVDKLLPPPSSGVVLPKPVIPEFIVVHEGVPNSPGPNRTVPFKEYIKNVASSEIYSTWSRSTITANAFCIISFTLNRIYTEWYRSKGKNFDITNSTAYDHAFSFGRNIYENISNIVDEIFSTYVRRIGRKQPLLTQYCDGKNVICPEWLSQWGSKVLGDQGVAPFNILTRYYGTDIELTTAEQVKGSPKSYPGFAIIIGSRGEPVRSIQEFLNRIADNYPLIPKVAVDGIFGNSSSQQVKVFQSIFKLPQSGIVDFATWYKISEVYVGVTRIAELR
ncbi:peptidoglycan-binding domain-containing protein [Clostridium baratii]|uniref:Spore cortex-lytic enzyme SleC n=1 Tax=Clostridium baratii TaxID=1561 RepID=A0A174UNF7_9CLOT|nr:peptidoglycan-binding domain-containing protein [Clostridium baratii]CUQ21587.1 spore cortex-lytic enzyme SleC [Clostridium baratii]